MAARVTSEIFVGALLRTARAGGAFGYVARRGNAQAGAVIVALADQAARSYDIYQSAPPGPDTPDVPDEDRRFVMSRTLESDQALRQFTESEARFDPDFWLVEIENWKGPVDGLIALAGDG